MAKHFFQIHKSLKNGLFFFLMTWTVISAHAQATAAVSLTEMVNPYGFSSLWEQGDVVSMGTLLILLLMSMGSWYVIAGKLWEQAQVTSQFKEIDAAFWKMGSIQQATDSLSEGSVFRHIATTGLACAQPATGLMSSVDSKTAVTMGIQKSVNQAQVRLQSGLALLATVGSTAPFAGLFGTVWGIYHALVKIGLSGQASIDKVAGPVGESLIMTALGLAVAVPAVLFYNWLVRRNKTLMDQIQSFGSDIHAVLLAESNT